MQYSVCAMNFLPRFAPVRSPWLLVLVIGSIFVCQAQSPADGHVEAHAYVNTYLHFTYTWPSMLHPRDVGSLQINAPTPLPGEFLLFAAQQTGKPFGIVIISEKLHVPTPHNPAGFKDGADFLNRIPIGWTPADHFKTLKTTHSTTPDGLSVDQMDYTVSDEFDSGIAIQFGDYIVVFKCNAASLADLDIMTKSILATRRSK
jgi:hypothetical protein